MGGATAPPGTAGTTDSRARGAKLPKTMEQDYKHYNIYRDGAVYSVLELKGGRKYKGKGVPYREGCPDIGEQAVVALVGSLVGGMVREREYLIEKAREEGVYFSSSRRAMLVCLRIDMKEICKCQKWASLRPALISVVKYLSALAPKPESSHYANWNAKVTFLSLLCLADAEYKCFAIPKPVAEPRQLELF